MEGWGKGLGITIFLVGWGKGLGTATFLVDQGSGHGIVTFQVALEKEHGIRALQVRFDQILKYYAFIKLEKVELEKERGTQISQVVWGNGRGTVDSQVYY